MRDPIPQSALLVGLTKPLADKLSLSTLPYHAHEVLLGFLGYHLVLHVLSPALARTLCPKAYSAFNRRTRLNWDIHCVSMVQALFINTAALFVIFNDPERSQSNWKDRLWGYSPATGMVQGFAAGLYPLFFWSAMRLTPFRLFLVGSPSIGTVHFGVRHGCSHSCYRRPDSDVCWFRRFRRLVT